MKYSTRSVHSEIVIHKSFIHVADMAFEKYKQEIEKTKRIPELCLEWAVGDARNRQRQQRIEKKREGEGRVEWERNVGKLQKERKQMERNFRLVYINSITVAVTMNNASWLPNV